MEGGYIIHSKAEAHGTFESDMERTDWKLDYDYHGRNFYRGPAILCERDELQEVIRATVVTLQWDQLGKTGLLVYPASCYE